jgi:hypothetical protein
MTYTFPELSHKTIDDLRAIAKGIDHEAVKGFTQMNKEHLLPALCKALGIDTHVHHHVEGVDKATLKQRMRSLKNEQEKAIEAGDRAKLRMLRRTRHRLNRRIRVHMV